VKAGVFYGPYDVRYEEVDDPILTGEDELDVLIKVEAAGICGSDINMYTGGYAVPEKAILGHELSGTVVKTGEGVTNVKPGDRVGIQPLFGCGTCVYCRTGDYHICQSLLHVGIAHSGGFAEYSKAPAKNVYRLPDHLTFEEASLLDCYAVAVHALKKVPVSVGDTVVVFGAGAVGLSTAQATLAAGASKVAVIGIHDNVLEVANKAGFEHTFNSLKGDVKQYIMEFTNGAGADIAFDTVGRDAPTLRQALNVIRPGGVIGSLGYRYSGTLDYTEAFAKEPVIIFISSYSVWGVKTEFEIALQIMANKRVDANALITHRIELKDINKGLEMMMDKTQYGVVKIVVLPNSTIN